MKRFLRALVLTGGVLLLLQGTRTRGTAQVGTLPTIPPLAATRTPPQQYLLSNRLAATVVKVRVGQRTVARVATVHLMNARDLAMGLLATRTCGIRIITAANKATLITVPLATVAPPPTPLLIGQPILPTVPRHQPAPALACRATP